MALTIEVKDNGVGFDHAAAAAVDSPHRHPSSKFGLFSVRERMRALGGGFDTHSTPGHGTTATLTLPLGAAADPAAQPRGKKLEAGDPELDQARKISRPPADAHAPVVSTRIR